MRKWFLKMLVFSTLAIAMVVGPAAPASAGQDDLSAVRKATAKFHSLEAAGKAGYASALNCFDLPGVGGMGQHRAGSSVVFEGEGLERRASRIRGGERRLPDDRRLRLSQEHRVRQVRRHPRRI